MIGLAMALVVNGLSEDYWIDKRNAVVDVYNIPDKWFFKDYTYIEVEYTPVNETCNFTSKVCRFAPDTVRGFLALTNGLPALYVDYEFLYDPTDIRSGDSPVLLALYHEREDSQYILSLSIFYLRNEPNWIVVVKIRTYKINISSNTVELVDQNGFSFSQVSNRISLFMKPTFYTKLEGDKSYLIFGFSGSFKNQYEEHSFQIAYDKVLLANSNQTFSENVRKSIDSVNKWYAWIGLGIVEYIPERSKLNYYSANSSLVDKIVEKVRIYSFNVEDWIVDHEKLYYVFLRGELPFYNEPTVENVYYYSSLTIKYLIPYFIGLGIAIGSMKIRGIGNFEGALISLVSWLIFGLLFFGYTLQLALGLIFVSVILLLMKYGEGGVESVEM